MVDDPTYRVHEAGWLTITVEATADVYAIRLEGELDIASAEQLDAELLHAEASDARAIRLDLSKLKFMDSTGIHLLVRAEARSHADSSRLGIVRPTEPTMRILTLTGVDELLPFVD